MNPIGCKGNESSGADKLFILGIYHLALPSGVCVPIDFTGFSLPCELGENGDSWVPNLDSESEFHAH